MFSDLKRSLQKISSIAISKMGDGQVQAEIPLLERMALKILDFFCIFKIQLIVYSKKYKFFGDLVSAYSFRNAF